MAVVTNMVLAVLYRKGSKRPERIAMHAGGSNEFRNLFCRDLKNDITLIVLTNQGDAFPFMIFSMR